MADQPSVHALVDHLFRREAGRMIAALVRSLGPPQLALAEEVVQEAMLRALKNWPFNGVPENPAAWLHRVARNLALDRLRRVNTSRNNENTVRETFFPEATAQTRTWQDDEINDDQLRLIFLCCHPQLSRQGRVALTLKTVAGFGTEEIARAFFRPKATIAQRLVRTKRRIRDLELPFEIPSDSTLPERLETVLEVLYLMFNEGYASRRGDELLRLDLCVEALRLVRELARNKLTNRPDVHALASLLSFQSARLPARQDAQGSLLRLADQDRQLWDPKHIQQAFAHLERAAVGDVETTYHLQAAIAAEHTSSKPGGTDWPYILRLYDRLQSRYPSPIIELNRAVAVAEVHGPQIALNTLDQIDHPALSDYYLLPATRAELLTRLGRYVEAAENYRSALDCPCSEPEQRFLRDRLEVVSDPSTVQSGED